MSRSKVVGGSGVRRGWGWPSRARPHVLVGALFAALMPALAWAQMAIPEPDVIYAGRIISLPSQAEVQIRRDGQALASTSPEGSVVILRVPLVSSQGEVPPDKASTGTTAHLVVNGVAQRALTIGERGTLYTWDNVTFVPTEPSSLPQLGVSECQSAACVPAEPCGNGPPCTGGSVCVTGMCVTRTPTPVVTPTPTRGTPGTPTNTPRPGSTPPTATPTPTPSATPTGGGCTGDCNGDEEVGINELISGVNIALDSSTVATCPSFDVNADGEVGINELIAAVTNALNGCPQP